jgi:hypothetical protein
MEHETPPIIAKTATGEGVALTRQERERHVYLVGKSGSGKSTALFNLAMHDIRAGEIDYGAYFRIIPSPAIGAGLFHETISGGLIISLPYEFRGAAVARDNILRSNGSPSPTR